MELLTAENEADFFSRGRPLKAVLFSMLPPRFRVSTPWQALTLSVPLKTAKKTETPKLWLRLADEWGSSCIFGEVRLSEQRLMEKFGVKEDDLPRVMAFVAEGEESKHQQWPHDGPSDFDRISDFLGDLAKGGTSFLEVRRLAEERKTEIDRLKTELEREREAVAIAKAEVARSMLGAVGQGEAMKERERALEAEADKLKKENEALTAEVRAMQEVQRERILKLKAENVEAFLSSATRPLKAVLFTTKSETPPLWQQLAEAQSTTTSFGVVFHTETALMEKWTLEVADLPRICIFSSGGMEPVVYDGEVKLDALSSFLRDTVEGGDAVIAMRQQVVSCALAYHLPARGE